MRVEGFGVKGLGSSGFRVPSLGLRGGPKLGFTASHWFKVRPMPCGNRTGSV